MTLGSTRNGLKSSNFKMENIKFCVATTKVVNWHTGIYNTCKNSAKFGEFCGIHKEKEIKETVKKVTCMGITKCGKQCQKPPQFGEFCSIHMYTEPPDHDWSEFKLYNPDINWPYIRSILCYVKKVKNGKELGKLFTKHSHQLGLNSTWNAFIPRTPSDFEQTNNLYTMVLMESFFRNYFLDFNTPHWQKIITDLHTKIEHVTFLKEYRELFRRKFDQEYRIQAQKMYIEKVLTYSDLGKDMAKQIMTFL